MNLFVDTPATLPASQPFHVAHGWVGGIAGLSDYDAFGKYEFMLEVDGRAMPADFVERVSDDGVLSRFWVFNFPAGLPAGQHTFIATWWGPCQALVDRGYDVGGPCTNETERRAVNGPLTRVVEFTRTNLALGTAAHASSEFPGSPASQAVDGNWHAIWNSGDFAPQWIELDLGGVAQVGEITLGVAQYALLQRFTGFTEDAQLLRYVAASPVSIRFVRVETVSSCSWVAWREIEVYGP